MVSPRKSRKKSLCFSRTVTAMPRRARRKPSMMPAGPPPMMQQVVASGLAVVGIGADEGSKGLGARQKGLFDAMAKDCRARFNASSFSGEQLCVWDGLLLLLRWYAA